MPTALTEAFKADHPDAYEAIFTAGANSVQPKPVTAAQMREAFPGPENTGFIVDQLEANATMEQATLAFGKIQSQRIEALSTENTSLKEQITAATAAQTKRDALANAAHPDGAEPTNGAVFDGAGAAPRNGGTNPAAEFKARVDKLVAEGATRPAAVAKVAQSDPDLYNAMMETSNKR